MSKVSNALIMLALLKSRGKMTRSELAKELECDKREISRYKDDLEMAGVRIKDIRGRYGGYVLEGKDYLLSLDLSDSEYAALNMGQKQLNRDEFLLKEEFKSACIKLNSLKKKHVENANTKYYIKNMKSNFNYEKERKIWLDINAAIITRNKLCLNYANANKSSTRRKVHPYAIFQYKGDLYFVGYCELRKNIRQFKLSRIKEYIRLNEKFIINKNFDLEEYLKNTIGIYKDGKQIDLKLKIYYPLAQVIKEKQIVEDEYIEDYKEDNYIIYKAKMFGETEIKSWVLSMGSNAEVLEPQSFKEVIKKELKKNSEVYK